MISTFKTVERFNESHSKYRYHARSFWGVLAFVIILIPNIVGCRQSSGPAPSILPTSLAPLPSKALTPSTSALLLSSPTMPANVDQTTFPLMEDLFQGKLSVEGKPLLNEPVRLTLSITPLAPASNATIRIFLPNTVELVEGVEIWTGNMRQNSTLIYDVSLKAVQSGQSRIRLFVEATFPESHKETHNYFVFFLSSENSGKIGLEPFENNHNLQQEPQPGGSQ